MFPKCSAIIGVDQNNKECDFFPVKFSPSLSLFAEQKRELAELRARVSELESECGKVDNELEYYREAGRFHPRALKLMRKRKNFVVVAVDEPYFGAVYWMIRGHEMAKGTWTPDDERLFQAALVENANKGGAS